MSREGDERLLHKEFEVHLPYPRHLVQQNQCSLEQRVHFAVFGSEDGSVELCDVFDPEVEVEFDSLGSLFMHLINNDLYQEDVEGSQADDVEVITLSTGSDSMPTQKTRQAV